jgi:hypothetical protein
MERQLLRNIALDIDHEVKLRKNPDSCVISKSGSSSIRRDSLSGAERHKLIHHSIHFSIHDAHCSSRAEEQAFPQLQFYDASEQGAICRLASICHFAACHLHVVEVHPRQVYLQYLEPRWAGTPMHHRNAAEIQQRSIKSGFLGSNDDACALVALLAYAFEYLASELLRRSVFAKEVVVRFI